MSEKQQQVRGKVKKLLLGKKELLLDKDDEKKDVQEQLASDVIRMAGNREGGYITSKWGNQVTNARRSMSDDPIVLARKAHFMLQDLYGEMGSLARTFEVVNGARTDGNPPVHIEKGELVVLSAGKRLTQQDMFNALSAILAAGWTGIEVMDANGDTTFAIDKRRASRNKLRLKLSSTDGSAKDRHPIAVLHQQEVSVDGVKGIILFNENDFKGVRTEGGAGKYENNAETSFVLTKDITVLDVRGSTRSSRDFEAADGIVFADKLAQYSTRQSRATRMGNVDVIQDGINVNLAAMRAAEQAIIDSVYQAAGAEPVGGLTVDRPAPGTGIQTSGTGFDARVQDYQKKLASLGFAPADGKIDGKHGPNSRAALMAFQRAEGMDPIGEFDPTTVAMIDAAVAKNMNAARTASTTSSSNTAPAPKTGVLDGIMKKMNDYVANKGTMGLVIPASVILAVGLGGAFAWRKFIKGRENAKIAKQLARDRDFQRQLQMLMAAEGLDTNTLARDRNVQGAIQGMERSEERSARNIEDLYI